MDNLEQCDEQDRLLLRTLQQDGRISNQSLAEKTAMSNSACWRRVKALEDANVIEGYTTLINPVACGLNFHAIVHVFLSRHASGDAHAFESAVLEHPEVLDCFATTGDADYHLRIRCKNIDAYNEFLESFLFSLDGVLNVKTNLVLRQIKHRTRLPV